MTRLLTLNIHGGLGQQLRPLTALVQACDADILCLQECHPAVMQWLQRALPDASGRGWTAAYAPASYLGNAVLGRFPTLRTVQHALTASERTEVRSALDVCFDHPDGPLRVVCTHLDHRSADARMAQWTQLSQHTDAVAGGLLVGDLNALKRDDYDAATLARVAAERAAARWEPPGFALLDALGAAGFVDAMAGHPPSWTSRFQTRIDYVLAAPDCPWRMVSPRTVPAIDRGVTDHNGVMVELQHI